MKAPQAKNKIIVVALAIVLGLVIIGGIIFAMVGGNEKTADKDENTQKATAASQEKLDAGMKDVRQMVELSKTKHETAKQSVADAEKQIKAGQ